MRRLGLVLAGGRSRRFGSDKALAEHKGRTLLDHAIAALAAQCEAVVVVGRDTAPVPTIADWPTRDLGPLGGLAGGLRHALAHGFDELLSAPVDVIALPPELVERLSPAPAVVADQPVIGLWPASAFAALDAFLAHETRHAVRAFADRIGAHAVTLAHEPYNINTQGDLAALRHPR